MEDVAVTNPVVAVEEPEITCAATMGSGPEESTTSDGSSGEGSEVSGPWSLTHDQQVRNLEENWWKILYFDLYLEVPEIEILENSSWFATVVSQLRDDHCWESLEFQIGGRLWIRPTVIGRVTTVTDIEIKMKPLDFAILMKDLKMVQKILKKSSNFENLIGRSDVNELPGVGKKDYFSHTPLHLAVLGGDSHILDVFLEKGANVNAQIFNGYTPLDLACKTRSGEMLLKLLENDEEGKQPLHVAVQHGDIHFIKELPPLNVNPTDTNGRTPLHYLAISHLIEYDDTKNTLEYLTKDRALDMKTLDDEELSFFYVAVLNCNTLLVIVLLDHFKDQIRLNEACNKDFGPPIQIAFEGGMIFGDIQRALMECDPVKGYMETLYRDRQVYVDAANAILVGAALIASVTFASWLQPPLSYTSYFGEGSSSFVLAPSTSDLNYVDVEHNIALRAFWIFNALSFYFAIGTVVCGARSVLPKSHLFIKKTVEKLQTNLLVTSILLACSVLFVIIAFAIAGTIVLTPLLKYQWYMIVPTLVGGMVCIISLVFLVKSMVGNYFQKRNFDESSYDSKRLFLEEKGYRFHKALILRG